MEGEKCREETRAGCSAHASPLLRPDVPNLFRGCYIRILKREPVEDEVRLRLSSVECGSSGLEDWDAGREELREGAGAKRPRALGSRSLEGAETLPGEAYPLTKVKLINELNERGVQLGVAEKVSWLSEYKDSAWIFLALKALLIASTVVALVAPEHCQVAQDVAQSAIYGEIVNISLVHNKKTGKSKGFCFLCYEDHRSTILAVDNFNGIKLGALGRRAVSLLGGNFCSPLTKLKLINDLKERGDQLGVAEKVSWHTEYKDSSSWIFLGELCRPVTSGDMICVFSRYGEIVNISLVHNKKTGKSKGFCFLCYEDHRSTILAVDNFNGIKIKGRTIRMDHVSNYRAPKDSDELDDVTRLLQEKGCGAHKPPKFSDEDSEDDRPTKKKTQKRQKGKKVNEEKREVQHDAPVSSSSPRSKMLKENNSPDCKKFNNKNSKKVQKSEFREGLKQGRSRDREPKKKKPKQEHRSLSRREEREEKNRDRDRDQRSDTQILAGTRSILNGMVLRVGVGAMIYPTGIKSWHSRNWGSPNSRDYRHH
ncbi:LOW QUALITY PROTEIN: uncharacterized protein LOC130018788 [Sorex fumeus]|uniref:LOW QUALITY PROTEIN: uncharacterized protein LOC130018788 n=1 Tax=Sorex fumeus TaxID=62283 RepID=UPI0024AD3620|nr:LOW QUALITY PROTEIN: uncharacterized protein LOC130018788 [Sorex fumeus]